MLYICSTFIPCIITEKMTVKSRNKHFPTKLLRQIKIELLKTADKVYFCSSQLLLNCNIFLLEILHSG